MRFTRVAKVALSNVEADIRFIRTNGVDDGFIGFKELTFVTTGADGIDQREDGRLGIEIVPLVFTHAFICRRVRLDVSQYRNAEFLHLSILLELS